MLNQQPPPAFTRPYLMATSKMRTAGISTSLSVRWMKTYCLLHHQKVLQGSTSYLTVHLNMQLTTFRSFNTKDKLYTRYISTYLDICFCVIYIQCSVGKCICCFPLKMNFDCDICLLNILENYITSPNFPHHYPHNHDEVWGILIIIRMILYSTKMYIAADVATAVNQRRGHHIDFWKFWCCPWWIW